MTIANVHGVARGFKVLQTGSKSQTAVMVLSPGEASSEEENVHEKSDQILLVIKGNVQAGIGKEERLMREGDVCLIPAGTPHRFENKSSRPAITFNVYSPPEYPA